MSEEKERGVSLNLNAVNTIIAVASLAASVVAISGQYKKDDVQSEREQDDRLCAIEANIHLGKCGAK